MLGPSPERMLDRDPRVIWIQFARVDEAANCAELFCMTDFVSLFIAACDVRDQANGAISTG